MSEVKQRSMLITAGTGVDGLSKDFTLHVYQQHLWQFTYDTYTVYTYDIYWCSRNLPFMLQFVHVPWWT